MRLANILLLTLLPTLNLFAQDEAPMRTLLGNAHDLHHGGWGAPTTDYTRIMDQDALLVGGRGGWLIDHRVTIGLAGQGLTTNITNAAYDDQRHLAGDDTPGTSRFFMGYGGLLIEPIIAYRSPVHLSLPLIIGAGGCGYENSGALPHDFDPHNYREDAKAFFVVEPGIDLEVNLIPLVRLGLGASYRYTSDIDLPGTASDALHGFNAGVRVKIGRF